MAGPRIRECRRVLAAADLGASHGFAVPYAYSIVNPGGTVRLVHVVEPFRRTNPLIGRYCQDLPTSKEHAHEVAEFEARLRGLAPTEVAAAGIKKIWTQPKGSARRRSASTQMSSASVATPAQDSPRRSWARSRSACYRSADGRC